MLARADQEAREALDLALRRLASPFAAEDLACPALIARALLETAEYPRAFPHLLFLATPLRDPGAEPDALLATDNLAAGDWCLSPAVCYHV
jgi:hypothetical protein